MSRTGDRTYQRNRKRVLATSDVCWLCGNWIDPELEYPDPFSASFDHDIPVSLGGDNRGAGQAAHLDCNKRRGNKTREQVMAERQPQHGRRW